MRGSERRTAMALMGAIVLLLAACDEQPTVPEVEAPPPLASDAVTTLLDRLNDVALEYELLLPGEAAGVEGEAIEVAPNGTVVIKRFSPPYGYWFRDGTLTPLPDVPGSAFILVRGILGDGTDRIHAVVGYPEDSPQGSLPAVFSPDGSYELFERSGTIRDGNRRGRLVGSFWNEDRRADEAAFWQDGVLNPLPPEYVEAYSVNDAGLMLVERRVFTSGVGFQSQLGLYDPSTGSFQAPPGQLGPVPTRYSVQGEGDGLNEAGQVILGKRPPEGGLQSVIWDGAQETTLPTLPGAFWVRGEALNDGGTVAAQASYPGDVYLPALYRDGVTELMDGYPGDRAGIRGLNASGRTLVSEIFSNESYVFAPESGFGVLPGRPGARTGVNDLNDEGLIVGSVQGHGGPTRPALWIPLGDEAVLRAIRGVLRELQEEGVIVHGVVNALSRKLDQGAYGAFVNQLEALVRSRRLEAEIAEALIAAVGRLDAGAKVQGGGRGRSRR